MNIQSKNIEGQSNYPSDRSARKQPNKMDTHSSTEPSTSENKDKWKSGRKPKQPFNSNSQVPRRTLKKDYQVFYKKVSPESQKSSTSWANDVVNGEDDVSQQNCHSSQPKNVNSTTNGNIPEKHKVNSKFEKPNKSTRGSSSRGRSRGRGKGNREIKVEYVAKDSQHNKTQRDQTSTPTPRKASTGQQSEDHLKKQKYGHRTPRRKQYIIEYKAKSSQQTDGKKPKQKDVEKPHKKNRRSKSENSSLEQQKKESEKKGFKKSPETSPTKDVKEKKIYEDIVKEGKDENLYYSTTAGMVVVSDQPGIKYDDSADEWNQIKTRRERLLEKEKEKKKQPQKKQRKRSIHKKQEKKKTQIQQQQQQQQQQQHSGQVTLSKRSESTTQIEKEKKSDSKPTPSSMPQIENLALSPDAPNVDISELQLPNVNNLGIKFGSWESEEEGNAKQKDDTNTSTVKEETNSLKIDSVVEDKESISNAKHEQDRGEAQFESEPEPEFEQEPEAEPEYQPQQPQPELVEVEPQNNGQVSSTQPILEHPMQHPGVSPDQDFQQGWEYSAEMQMEGVPPGHPTMQGMVPVMDEYQMAQQFTGDMNPPMQMVYGQPWQAPSGAPMQPSNFSYSHNMYPSSPYMFVPPWYVPNEWRDSPPPNYPPYPYMPMPEEQEFQQHQHVPASRRHNKRRHNNPNQGFYHPSGTDSRHHHPRSRGRNRRYFKRSNQRTRPEPST